VRRAAPRASALNSSAGRSSGLFLSRITTLRPPVEIALRSMKCRLILTILVLPIIIAARLPAAFNPDSPLYSRVAGRIEIPAELCDKTLFVKVAINGHGPFRMMVDTGASVTMITPAVAAAINEGVEDDEEAPVEAINGFGNESALSCVLLRTLEMNGAQFEGVRAGVVTGLAPLAQASGQKVDGVIGFSLFSNVFVALDFPGRRLVLDAGWPKNLAPIRAELDVHEAHEVPFVTARLQGRNLDLMIDTGSNRGLLVTPEMAEPLTWKAEPRPGPLVSVIGQTAREYVGRAGGELHVEQVTQIEPIVAISDGEPSLGVEFLQRFCVVFDQAHDKMWLCAAGDDPVPSPAEHSLGLSLIQDGAGWRVAATIPGSPAEGVGIVSGDIVTRIEGKPATRWSRDQIDQWTDGHSQVALSIRHDRSSRDITLPVWALVP
jgi:predicted aspartyl protease